MHFHSRIYGTGHPLIILHGLFGSLDNWATLGRRLGERFQVFTFDARNHGSSSHRDEMTFEAMANDVSEFMAKQGIESTFLLGHSMGGKTAMLFAATFPTMVDRLVVVDIAPKEYGRVHDAVMDALTEIDLTKYQDRKHVDQALSLRIHDHATRQFLAKNLARDESGRFRWKINLRVIQEHYAEIMKGLPSALRFVKPTLFIKGGSSNYIVDEDAIAIRQMFPRSTLLTIKKAGHWVHVDAPEAMYKAVVRFLSNQ